MAQSTWHGITNGIHAATDRAYKRKSSQQRARRDVREAWDNYEDFCREAQRHLLSGDYIIGEYRHFRLRDKKKERDISVLPFRDRCVQNAVKEAIEPMLMRQMTDDMLGGLPGRGVLANVERHCVVRRMQRIMANRRMTHYIQGDIRKFYDSIDNVTAIRIIEQSVKDKRTLAVIRQHLFKQKRLAIGDPFSHLIANLVMSRLVRHLKRKHGKAIAMVNFADDIFITAEGRERLEQVRKDMRRYAKQRLRLHYKPLYIRAIDEGKVSFCGMRYDRDTVMLTQRTKKRYITRRHKRRSMGAYNGIMEKCDTRHLRRLIEQKDNKHMAEKIRRPFAGRPMRLETMVGIRHTIVDKAEKPSRQQHSQTYWHVQAIADGLGLVVYSTSSPKIAQFLATNTIPIRDMVIQKDWSGFYYEGTVYTDAEEEAMIREKFNIK